MAPTRKTTKRTVPAKIGVKHKGPKRRPVNATQPQSKATPSTALPAEPPGFLIVGIGASAGGLEAMEEMRVREGEGKVEAKVERRTM